jgi:hypothetical protein
VRVEQHNQEKENRCKWLELRCCCGRAGGRRQSGGHKECEKDESPHRDAKNLISESEEQADGGDDEEHHRGCDTKHVWLLKCHRDHVKEKEANQGGDLVDVLGTHCMVEAKRGHVEPKHESRHNQ